MRRLHERLLSKGGFYSQWHDSKGSTATHFALLLIVGLLTAFYINASGVALISEQQLAVAAEGFSRDASLQSLQFMPGRALVKFLAGVPAEEKSRALAAAGASIELSIPHVGIDVVRVPEKAEEKVIAALRHNPRVQFAELDGIVKPFLVPNDPYFANGGWHLNAIHAPNAWDVSTGSPSVIIAIVDNGIDSTHEDLQANMIPGWNAYSNNTTTYLSCGSHGTAVAGSAGAVGNNAIGVTGVTWTSKIMPVVLSDNSCTGNWGAMANGIIWAADHGARVINVSWGGPYYSSSLQSAVNYAWGKGAVVVASAGNDGTDVKQYPAALDNVVAVGAVGSALYKSSFSSYGTWVDIVAPGSGIQTTDVMGAAGYSSANYASMSGTSFSSPITAGAIALLFSANPKLTNAQAVDLITKYTDDLGDPGFDQYYGNGLVSLSKAITQAVSTGTFVDTIAPTASVFSSSCNSACSSQKTITVRASDNYGVAKAEIYKDGSLVATMNTQPFDYYWDTTKEIDGSSHTFFAKAFDYAGNSVTSATVTFKVDNIAPTVTITSPSLGQTVSGTTTLVATQKDNLGGSVYINWYLDGKNLGDYRQTGTYYWDSRTVPDGSHTLVAEGVDAANNKGYATTTILTKNNVADASSPTTSLYYPSSGDVISGVVLMIANASDNDVVSKVELWKDGTLYAAFNSRAAYPPYELSFDTTKETNGSHTLVTKAYDAAGNVGISGTVTVTIQNTTADTSAPTTSITSPSSGATVTGLVTVSASASDNLGVTKVELYEDGILVGTDTSAPYSWSWNSVVDTNASHSLQTKAYDAAGNVGVSTAVNISVNNAPDTTAPVVSITSPKSGAVLKGNQSLSISVSASDQGGIAQITIYADGIQLNSCTAVTSCTASWQGKSINSGTHKIDVIATDVAGNSASASVTVKK